MTKQKWFLIGLMTLALAFAGGCVYRANIAQGNVVKEEDLAQVEVGMTRNQVRFLLGTPMVDDPFHRDRWDYVYYVTVGRSGTLAKRWVTVFFDDDLVSEILLDQELNPDL
jgi:outer membrane protein assembly factor BamE